MKTLPQDPMILLSFVNTKLRDDYDSPDLLCEDLEVDRRTLEAKLAEAGFRYDPGTNQYR